MPTNERGQPRAIKPDRQAARLTAMRLEEAYLALKSGRLLDALDHFQVARNASWDAVRYAEEGKPKK